MYENDFMYAVERSPEYLAHYGIRGMKWGVRKAIASGNSARLGRQYAKAQKKLAKLEKRAGKTKKYARRAALMGTGAAAAGGLAALGTKGTVNVMGGITRGTRSAGNALMNASRGLHGTKVGKIMNKAGLAMVKTSRAGGGMHDTMAKGAKALNTFGNSNSIGKALSSAGNNARNAIQKVNIGYGKVNGAQAIRKLDNALVKSGRVNSQGYINKLSGVSNNTIARIGAGVVGAGLAAGAAKNAYRAATAKKKAEKFRSEMNKAFAGTKYANGGGGQPRQGTKRRRR